MEKERHKPGPINPLGTVDTEHKACNTQSVPQKNIFISLSFKIEIKIRNITIIHPC